MGTCGPSGPSTQYLNFVKIKRQVLRNSWMRKLIVHSWILWGLTHQIAQRILYAPVNIPMVINTHLHLTHTQLHWFCIQWIAEERCSEGYHYNTELSNNLGWVLWSNLSAALKVYWMIYLRIIFINYSYYLTNYLELSEHE